MKVRIKGKQKGINLKTVVILIISALLFAMGITFFIFSTYHIVETRTIQSDLFVDDIVGFNIDTDALHFGTVFPGGVSVRSMIITSPYDFPVMVDAFAKGENAEWFGMSDNHFILQPYEKKSLNISMNPPSNIELDPERKYEGQVVFIMKRIR